MDCRNALSGHLYVCPCLLVIQRSGKARLATTRLSVPACDSQEYESYRRCGKPLVPRWRGIKGVDRHKQEFRQVYSLNIHKVCRMGEAAAHPSIEILMLVQACSLNRTISVQSRTI